MIGVRVPESLRRKLKELAAREGTTSQDILAEMIEEWTTDAEPRKSPSAPPRIFSSRY